jgi:four helix bundle protein
MRTQSTFSFENLDVYKLSLSVNERVAATRWPVGRSHLKDQAIRAADSVVLNISEGCGRGRLTKAGKNHFRIALGSAGEVFAVFQMLRTDPELQDDLRRVGAMLAGLAR